MPSYRMLPVVIVAFWLPLGPTFAGSTVDMVARYIENPRKIGEGILTILFWDVYRAELYAPMTGWRPDAPFALSLKYLRDLKGADIVDRTISEMRGQGFYDDLTLNAWRGQLQDIFPNVSDGTRLTGVRDNEGNTVFFRDGNKIGEVKDPAFTRRFFDIWLGARTSEPDLRRALFGGT